MKNKLPVALATMLLCLAALTMAAGASATALRQTDGTVWERIDDSVIKDYSVDCTQGIQPVYNYEPVRDVDLHTQNGQLVELVFRRDGNGMPLSDRFNLTVGDGVTCRIGEMTGR